MSTILTYWHYPWLRDTYQWCSHLWWVLPLLLMSSLMNTILTYWRHPWFMDTYQLCSHLWLVLPLLLISSLMSTILTYWHHPWFMDTYQLCSHLWLVLPLLLISSLMSTILRGDSILDRVYLVSTTHLPKLMNPLLGFGMWWQPFCISANIDRIYKGS